MNHHEVATRFRRLFKPVPLNEAETLPDPDYFAEAEAMTPLTPERRQQIRERLAVAEQHAANKTSPYKWWSTALSEALQHIEMLEQQLSTTAGKTVVDAEQHQYVLAKVERLERERDGLISRVPSEQPKDATGKDRLLLNAYGRRCYRAGAEKAEGLVRQAFEEGWNAGRGDRVTLASDRHRAFEASAVKRILDNEGWQG